MSTTSTIDDKAIESFLNTAFDALSWIAQYRAIFDAWKEVTLKDHLSSIHLMNGVGCMAAIRLSNIYGSYSEENHWHKFITSESLRNELIKGSFGSVTKFVEVHDNLVKFRDEFAVHSCSIQRGVDYVFPKISEFKELLCNTIDAVLKSQDIENADLFVLQLRNLYDDYYSNTKQLFVQESL